MLHQAFSTLYLQRITPRPPPARAARPRRRSTRRPSGRLNKARRRAGRISCASCGPLRVVRINERGGLARRRRARGRASARWRGGGGGRRCGRHSVSARSHGEAQVARRDTRTRTALGLVPEGLVPVQQLKPSPRRRPSPAHPSPAARAPRAAPSRAVHLLRPLLRPRWRPGRRARRCVERSRLGGRRRPRAGGRRRWEGGGATWARCCAGRVCWCERWAGRKSGSERRSSEGER
mgnify:CR=1 FL=1